MHTITFVAVISNSFIIGFTSAAAFELLVDEGEESSSIEDRCAAFDLENPPLQYVFGDAYIPYAGCAH